MWGRGGRGTKGAYRLIDIQFQESTTAATTHNMSFTSDFTYPAGSKKLLVLLVLGCENGSLLFSPSSVTLEGTSGDNLSGGFTISGTTSMDLSCRTFDNAAVNSIKSSAAGGTIDLAVNYASNSIDECFAALLSFEAVDQTAPATNEDSDQATNWSITSGGDTKTLTATGDVGQIAFGVVAAVDAGLSISNTILKGPTQADQSVENAGEVVGKLHVWVDESMASTTENYAYGLEDTLGSHTYDEVRWQLWTLNRAS